MFYRDRGTDRTKVLSGSLSLPFYQDGKLRGGSWCTIGDKVFVALYDESMDESDIRFKEVENVGLPFDPDAGLVVAAPAIFHADAVFMKDIVPNVFEPHDKEKTELRAKRRKNEIDVLERLNKHPHPNIVRYLGCRVTRSADGEDRITGIALEKVRRCLAYYDPASPNFKDIDMDRLLTRLEETVAFLHNVVGLVHNDIKPSNVMIRDDGQPVLIDFDRTHPDGEDLLAQGAAGGSHNWTVDNKLLTASAKENDLYALRLMRERIRDWDLKKHLFQYH